MTDRPLAALLADPDDALWSREEAAAVLRVRPKSIYGIPGLVRTELPGRGNKRRMVRYRAGDVRQFVRQCRRTGEDRVA